MLRLVVLIALCHAVIGRHFSRHIPSDDGQRDGDFVVLGDRPFDTNASGPKYPQQMMVPEAAPIIASPFNCKTDYMLIFSLGKSGTEAFHESMQKLCGWGVPYTHQKKSSYGQGMKTHEEDFDIAKDFLSKLSNGSTVWIPTFLRNPFDRMISRFFQLHWNELTASNKTSSNQMEEATQLFEASLKQKLNGQSDGATFWPKYESLVETPIETFAQDMTIRVSQHPDQHVAWQSNMYMDGSQWLFIQSLVLRLEDAESWPQALKDIIPGFETTRSNTATERPYADLYAAFKAHYRYSQENLDMLLGSKSLLFYSPSELENMVALQTRKR